MNLLDYKSEVPNPGETLDQFNKRTGRGFFLNTLSRFEDTPITQSWEGDIIYWDNKIKEAERMKSQATFNHNEKVRKSLNK